MLSEGLDTDEQRSRSRDLAWLATFCFCAFAFVGNSLLPARFSADSQAMMEGAQDASGFDTSYRRMSETIALLSYEGVTLLTILLGAVVILRMTRSVRTRGSAIVLFMSFTACVPMNLIRPQKELYVILLSIFTLAVMYRMRDRWQAFAITILYTVYAIALGRIYYFPIIVLIMLLLFLQRCTPAQRVVILGVVVVALVALVPSEPFEQLQGTRDALNWFRVLDPSEPGNRTAFMNPFTDVGWLQFIGNYLYAALRLNIPIIFSQSPQELFLTIIAVAWMFVVVIGFRSSYRPARIAATIITSHVLVLWLFEPDLGSYLRHLTSLVIYLHPLLRVLDTRKLAVERSLPIRGGLNTPDPRPA